MGFFDNFGSEETKRRKSEASKSKLKCKCEGGSYCTYYERGKCISSCWCAFTISSVLKSVLDSRDVKYRKGSDGLFELLDDCPYYVGK